jgi:hypothetical protein
LGPSMAADEQKFVHQTGGLPALLAVHEAILFTALVRIIEYERCDLEIHPVFTTVLAVLGLIPFEAHSYIQ